MFYQVVDNGVNSVVYYSNTKEDRKKMIERSIDLLDLEDDLKANLETEKLMIANPDLDFNNVRFPLIQDVFNRQGEELSIVEGEEHNIVFDCNEAGKSPVSKIELMLNKPMLKQIVLEDDNLTTHSGFSDCDETALEFVKKTTGKNYIAVHTLNQSLKECGIKQLSLRKLSKMFGLHHMLAITVYALDRDEYILEKFIMSFADWKKLCKLNYSDEYEKNQLVDQDMVTALKDYSLEDIDAFASASIFSNESFDFAILTDVANLINWLNESRNISIT